MFTEITWAMYLRILAALLFIYYTLLILKFYFPQIRASVSSLGTGGDPVQAQGATVQTQPSPKATGNLTSTGSFANQGVNDYETIEELVERVKSVLGHAVEAKVEATQVASSFKTVLSDYPTLAISTFRPSINEFIVSESELSGYAFSQEAVEQLWPKI